MITVQDLINHLSKLVPHTPIYFVEQDYSDTCEITDSKQIQTILDNLLKRVDGVVYEEQNCCFHPVDDTYEQKITQKVLVPYKLCLAIYWKRDWENAVEVSTHTDITPRRYPKYSVTLKS